MSFLWGSPRPEGRLGRYYRPRELGDTVVRVYGRGSAPEHLCEAAFLTLCVGSAGPPLDVPQLLVRPALRTRVGWTNPEVRRARRPRPGTLVSRWSPPGPNRVGLSERARTRDPLLSQLVSDPQRCFRGGAPWRLSRRFKVHRSPRRSAVGAGGVIGRRLLRPSRPWGLPSSWGRF